MDNSSLIGYEERQYIVSDQVEVRFFAHIRAWSELRASAEWTAFENLLEEYQKEYLLKKHLAAECQMEAEDCT